MRYLPHTAEEIQSMLKTVGVPSIDALFESVPEGGRFAGPLNLSPTLDEMSLMRHLTDLGSRNRAASCLSFLGAGMYDHHIPPAVDQLLLRSEFYTAYTPYQAEVAQGTLQSIFEFQTTVAELYGMEVANASMYDAASAAAEAVLMARRIKKMPRCILSAGLHPHQSETIHSYLGGLDETPRLVTVPLDERGTTDLGALDSALAEPGAAVVVGYPNYLGAVEPLREIRARAEKAGYLLIVVNTEPYALSILESPGALGADIVVGEGQGLAVPAQYGGPGVGLFACREGHVRNMPGRLVGETVDADGKPGFVLTLSTREQHIRRERATSNICTNHGLIALAMTIRTAMLGRVGFEKVGRRCLRASEYLKGQIAELKGFSIGTHAPTYNEFSVKFEGDALALLEELRKRDVLGGVPLKGFDAARASEFLVAVTERHQRAELDLFVSLLQECAEAL